MLSIKEPPLLPSAVRSWAGAREDLIPSVADARGNSDGLRIPSPVTFWKHKGKNEKLISKNYEE
jgi:hypothetical protein